MPNNHLRDIIHDGVGPQRAASSLRVCDTASGGSTTWRKRKVQNISAPLRGGAYARTIRIHELLHANNTPAVRRRSYPQIAHNAIEDARVHFVYWPDTMPKRAN